ncbi:MAG: M20/M25/M40 family metallo-hydrolase [Actinomycetota bacterium]|nr:M20/M25/M40 family metallo-hydrolase [Actinomycetota bacterium]
MSDARLLETFLDLVRIDSPTGAESQVAEYCARQLKAAGCTVRFDDSAEQTGADVGNIIAHLEGSEVLRTLVLSAHMDCVDPCAGVEPVVEGGLVRSAGDTVLGGDDKAGIAAIIESIHRLAESGSHHGPVRVVLTVSEETGLQGAKALDHSVLDGGDLCLVLDADGEPGGIVIGAPTHYTFAAMFMGTTAHAGVSPEKGTSAISMAAKAICAFPQGRLDDETTANVGTISGGTATNVIPGSVLVTGECRSLDAARVELLRSGMEQAMNEAARAEGGRVTVTWTREYEGFRFDQGDPVVDLVSAACVDVGLVPRTFNTGGGSDGSIFASRIPTLVLSCGMSEVHSTSEQIKIADLESLTALMGAVIARMAK